MSIERKKKDQFWLEVQEKSQKEGAIWTYLQTLLMLGDEQRNRLSECRWFTVNGKYFSLARAIYKWK